MVKIMTVIIYLFLPHSQLFWTDCAHMCACVGVFPHCMMKKKSESWLPCVIRGKKGKVQRSASTPYTDTQTRMCKLTQSNCTKPQLPYRVPWNKPVNADGVVPL